MSSKVQYYEPEPYVDSTRPPKKGGTSLAARRHEQGSTNGKCSMSIQKQIKVQALGKKETRQSASNLAKYNYIAVQIKSSQE